MRLIDADGLEAAFAQLADKCRKEGHEADAQLLEALAAIVKFCPTVDVPADVVPAVGSPVDGCPAVGKAGDVDAT